MPRQKKQKLIGLGVPANLLKEFIDLSYKGNTSIAPEGYEIDAPLSDSRVKVYKKPDSKEVIVVHRGSVGLQDWLDNAKFLVAGKVKSTKTYKMHRERHLKAIEKYGAENIIGIGHSRAGLYLQELQKEVPIKEIITYNKAVGFYDALRTNPAEQTDVKVKNDFVSLLSGLQKRKKKMVEIEATKNPLDFNAAHQPAELEKLGETFIGKKDEEVVGSGRAPSPKTLEQLKKKLKTLEGKLDKINKGKVYKTTNKEKVEYELSYTKARIKNHETKGEDLIITKKKKYKNELPAKAKAYKAKEVKPKEVKPEPKKEEPKKEEPKKEEPKPILEVPVPEPTPKKIEPLINKLETKIKEFEALGKKHGAVIYNGDGFVQVVAYIALLIEYEAKCAIIGKKNLNHYNINSQLDNGQNTAFYNAAEKLSKDLLDCIKRGDKMIAMPLNLNFGNLIMGHANLLIYRPYENTIERFEPYGELPDISADKTFNIVLKRMFEVEMKPYLKELTPKFIEPNQICPNIKGFQALEEELGLLEQEGGGFCAMWSLFILELIFLNPTLSTKEIIQQGLTLSKSNPQYLRNVIRGYVLKIEKMLDSYVKKIGINDGFNFKTTNNLKKDSLVFQEQLLNLLLSFGGTNSKIKELEESIKLEKLLSTKTNLEINNMAKSIFKSNFGVHNYKKWTTEDMIKFITNTYLIPDTPKYKADYRDKIFKYFEEPKKEEPEPKPTPKKEEPKPTPKEPIEMPEPEPTKIPIEPLINKLEKKIEEFEKVGREYGAVIYDPAAFIQVVAYIALLLEYEAKCAIVGDDGEGKREINSKLRSPMNKEFYEKAEELSGDLLDCIEREDKLIAIPLRLRFGSQKEGHANLLIYRPFEKTIERFEPHGNEFQGKAGQDADKVFNSVLTRMFEVEMKPYLKEYTPKFISPDQVCPNPRGFQSLEGQVERLNQEGGGFCGMWSLFVLELLFINPTKPTAEIIKEALAISKEDPQYLRNVIRGYVLKTEKMLDSYIKKIDANDGFSFNRANEINNNKTQFQEKLLELLLSFGGKNSQVKKLQKTLTTIKEKKNKYNVLIDLLIDKSYSEINGMMVDVFNTRFTGKNWTINSMIDNIINKLEDDENQLPDDFKYDRKNKIFEYFNEPIPTIEGGIFGWSDKEKAAKAESKMLREEYYKTHNRQQNANYTFDKSARDKWKKEFYAKNSAPKAEEDAEQQGVTETEPLEGSGYRKSYIEEIANPSNPIFYFKPILHIPLFIDPENEYLITDEMYGGSAADMLGMNCYDGKCFNPVWEKEKIKRQILSEYKIWYWPWGTPPAGHIRMPWLNAMVEERYKPLYDEFVARRNVNIGLDANASKDDFGRQMFSNLTDALSYVPVLNLPTTIGLSVASAVADIKKDPVEPDEPDEPDTD